MRILASASTLLLGAGLAAQGTVTPAHFTRAEANTSQSYGLGITSTPSDLLGIYEEFQGAPITVRGVSFRRDGVSPTTKLAVSTLLVNVLASTAQTTATAPSSTFANNHGPDKTQVSQFAQLNFPETVFVGPRAPFEYKIPFSQPFNFGGTGPLCLEIQVTSRVGPALTFDYASSSSTNPPLVMRSFGAGCIAAGQTSRITLTASGTPSWTNKRVTLTYTGARLPKSAVVVVGLGISNTALGGLALPFELPGTSGAPSGACNIYNDFLATVPALTNTSGAMTLNLPVTVNPAFNGANVFGQIIAPDAGQNQWGHVTSNSVQHHVVAPYAKAKVGTVYSNTTLGPTGTVRASEGYVVRIDM